MEIFNIIKDFENYSVSNLGNVKNNLTGRVLKTSLCKGYQRVNLSKDGKSKTVYNHQLVAEHFLLNPENKLCVDHIDNDKENNKISNLRYATHIENGRNSSISKKNTSGVKGVYFHKPSQKWMAYIGINKKLINIGLFETLEEAKIARQARANLEFGEYINLIEEIKTKIIILENLFLENF